MTVTAKERVAAATAAGRDLLQQPVRRGSASPHATMRIAPSSAACALAVAAVATLPLAVAATGEFTWVAGPSTVEGFDAEEEDAPAARCCAQSWATAERLYLFGGSATPFLGDMWQLELGAPGQGWKRVVGGGCGANSGGNSSVPSARSYAVTWTQGTKLWMWGGFGSSKGGDADGHLLTDMWSFDTAAPPGTGWRAEPQSQGGGRVPQGRNWCNFWAAEGGQELWLHAGMGGDLTNTYGYAISDLWRFDVANASWTQIYDYSCTQAPSGHPWTCERNPGVVYSLDGQQRGMRLKPGYRSNSYTTTDSARGDLWLYGGEGGITHPNGTIVVRRLFFGFVLLCFYVRRALQSIRPPSSLPVDLMWFGACGVAAAPDATDHRGGGVRVISLHRGWGGGGGRWTATSRMCGASTAPR